jgi:hypothetical protein
LIIPVCSGGINAMSSRRRDAVEPARCLKGSVRFGANATSFAACLVAPSSARVIVMIAGLISILLIPASLARALTEPRGGAVPPELGEPTEPVPWSPGLPNP